MSRLQRQQAILRAVRETSVRSQRDLIAHLEAQGLTATQATVSRDIRQLGLVKVPTAEGGARYGAPGELAPETSDDELRDAFQRFIVDVGPASHMLVLRTQSGHANAAAIAIDHAEIPDVVGTLAGDDTILILLASKAAQGRVLERFRELLS